jgi:thiol-disulfide isomerase/thioredoxin
MLILNLILNVALAAIPAAPVQGQPMKSPMGFVLNQVLNGDLTQNKLEEAPIQMKSYQLFVYVGANCTNCKSFVESLQKLAQQNAKKLNVVLVYDYATKSSDSLKAFSQGSSTFEYLDERGYMYHRLFTQPQYLNYILTGPQHTVISESRLSSPEEVQGLLRFMQKN